MDRFVRLWSREDVRGLFLGIMLNLIAWGGIFLFYPGGVPQFVKDGTDFLIPTTADTRN